MSGSILSGIPVVVLVYTGMSVPKYIQANLAYLRRTFPEVVIWLVSDNPRSLAKAESLGIRTYLCADPQLVWKEVQSSIPFSLDFRNGFWFRTVSRFVALYEFMSNVHVNSIIHLEADVWIAPDFPFQRLLSIEEPLAFPLVNKDHGVASVMYVRDRDAMETVIRAAEAWARSGVQLTDMWLLGRIAQESVFQTRILPSAPPWPHLFRDDSDPTLIRAMTRDIDEFGGVFDGADWGMHLLGEDPRNHWGVLRLFRDNDISPFQVSQGEVAVTANGCVRLIGLGDSVPLFALHVHAKDLHLFREPGHRLAMRIAKRANGHADEWLPPAFFSVCAMHIRRRIGRLWRRMLK